VTDLLQYLLKVSYGKQSETDFLFIAFIAFTTFPYYFVNVVLKYIPIFISMI